MTGENLLLLGVTDPSAPPVFSDAPHIRVQCADWTALALPVRLDPTEDEEARMTRWAVSQGEILCRQVRVSDVLPVKLGAVFSTCAALRAHVEAQHAELRDIAEACGGCVEFSVQAFADGEAPAVAAVTPKTGGRAFLDRRRAARDRRSRAASDRRGYLSGLGAALGPMSRSVLAKDVQGRGQVADWAVLLSRRAVDAMLAGLQDWDDRARHHGLRLRVTGPWPPFAFIGQVSGDRGNAVT
jgi:hypothetical protein